MKANEDFCTVKEMQGIIKQANHDYVLRNGTGYVNTYEDRERKMLYCWAWMATQVENNKKRILKYRQQFSGN